MIGIMEKIFEVVDDGDVEGAARATSDLLAEFEVFLCDLEQVPARTRVRVRLQLLVPLHVLDLHIVVRHRVFTTQQERRTLFWVPAAEDCNSLILVPSSRGLKKTK